MINIFSCLRRCVVFGVMFAVFKGLLVLPTLAADLENVPLYGLFETTIDYKAMSGQSHSYPDPFYGIDIDATFTSPSGRQVTWWGFFDGDGQGGQVGDIWVIRFMPDELGTWNFDWRFSDGSLSGSGSFQAVDNAANPRKPGPLRHDPNIHQWLVTTDGSRHVFLNMLQNENVSSPSIYTDPQFHIDRVVTSGFEVLMANGPSSGGGGSLDAANPFAWMDKVNYVPRMQGWYLLENGLFKKLYEQNIYFYDWSGFYAGNGWIDLHTKPIEFQDKVIKYWIVRTAPYYFYLYNIGFELPEFVSVPTWPVQRAKYVKDIDPWDHLITGHELREWSYGNSPVVDFSSLQNDGYSNKEGFLKKTKTMAMKIKNGNIGHSMFDTLRGKSFHDIALIVWNSPSQPHPHCNECIWNAKWQEPGTEESHRKDLWDGITGGMSFGFLAKDSEIGLTAFQNANTFLKSGVKWWTMSPHDEVVVLGTAYVLANIGIEYIVYSSSGGSFVLNMPSGKYQMRWFDPANGMYGDSTNLGGSVGNVTFDKPNTKDWVLHIKSN
ncbi:MAG: DUF5060 domain-containing protein [Planctomycetota bacterium]|jgi:hypothetical protein